MENVVAADTPVSASILSVVTVNRHIAHTSAAKTKQNRSKLPHFPSAIYVQLAKSDTSDCESDQSLYDSLNEIETDTAKDESDYSDGYSAHESANWSAVEYEVDDLSDSEAIESHDTSSGMNDEVQLQSITSASICSKNDSMDLENVAQDADMEESDGPTDQELGRTDYSTCIKCKNQINNPLYRYCKKCYQIRKTHFPPRPKHRRKRIALACRDNSQIGLNSPSTTWSLSMQDEKHDHNVIVDDKEDGRVSRISCCTSKDHLGDQFMRKSMQEYQQRRPTMPLQKHQPHQQMHSAGESSCCSSQDLSLDDQSYLMTVKCVPSQAATCCSDIEKIDSNQSNNNNCPSSQENDYLNAELTSEHPSFMLETGTNGTLTKFDSSASTVSAFSLSELSQSSIESNSAVTNCVTSTMSSSTASKSNSSIACDSNVTTTIIMSDTVKNATTSTTATVKQTDSDAISSIRTLTKRNVTGEASDIDDDAFIAKKFRSQGVTDSSRNDLCMICLSEPKNGAFVHNQLLHVCCCYRCAVKVWNKRKRCPICNTQVKNVLRIFIH